MDFDRDRPCVWKVHISHVAKDQSGQLVRLVEITGDGGCPALLFETTRGGEPWLELEKQVWGLATGHGLGVFR